MKRIKKILLGVIGTILFVSSASLAGPGQGDQGSGGWGMGSQYQRMFNPAAVETVSGTVESVDKMTPMGGMSYGVHLMLNTGQDAVDIHLGPGWFLDRQDTRIEKGDKIDVKGSRVTVGGKPAIIAQEVKKGDQVLVLRDNNGVPAWAGWRR